MPSTRALGNHPVNIHVSFFVSSYGSRGVWAVLGSCSFTWPGLSTLVVVPLVFTSVKILSCLSLCFVCLFSVLCVPTHYDTSCQPLGVLYPSHSKYHYQLVTFTACRASVLPCQQDSGHPVPPFEDAASGVLHDGRIAILATVGRRANGEPLPR